MSKKLQYTFFAVLLMVGMFFSLVAPTTALAKGPEPQASITVDPAVLTEMDANGSASYWVDLTGKTDLDPAYTMSWTDRGWYVYDQLSKTAASAQANVAAYLDGAGVTYTPYWIKNTIYVENSPAAVLAGLMGFSEISGIRAPQSYILYEPDRSEAVIDSGVMAVEPNLLHINADDAWALGYTGSGLVVSSIDTGVRYTHQALVNQYRGNEGGGIFIHDYNWFDPYGNYVVPTDANGHGTHTMGTMVGDDGGANQIGIAPGAEWMACRGCSTSACADTALLACAQFIAAPTTVIGTNPDPDQRPDVVNNSWGDCGQSYDPWYQDVVNAWLAGGIYPVFSNGNSSNCGYSSPPGLNTVGNPARYGNVTGVGSTGEQNGQYATHSNWGPTDNLDTVNPTGGFDMMKPQVLAPGVSIRSSTPGSDSEYQDGWSGTSMSAPHVTGLVALVWQAAPCLVGNYAITENLIEETAVDMVYEDGSPLTPTNFPNFATGWGEIDALAAVVGAAGLCGNSTLTGTVTDVDTSDPLAGAKVEITGTDPANDRTVYTNASGVYSANVGADTFDIAVTMFGYEGDSVTGVVVADGATVVVDFQLAELTTSLVSGTVYDGGVLGLGSHGYPLYAALTFAAPGFNQTIYNDPFTGEYEIELYFGQEYDVTVAAIPGGYDPFIGTYTPDADPDTQDYYLYVPEESCAAPGYQPEYDVFFNFEGTDGGFTVSGTTSWAWGIPTSGPGDAHSGDYVWATNPAGQYGNYEDGYTTSPAIDLTFLGTDTPVLEWYQWLVSESGYDYASVQVSKDGGTTWTTVYGEASGTIDETWTKHTVVLDSTYNVANFLVRFRFRSDVSGNYDGWYVDDVGIFGFSAPPVTVVWTEDFEATDGGLTHGGDYDEWEWGTPTTTFPGGCAQGTSCWDTDLDGNYEGNSNYYLMTPAIDLSGVALPPGASLYFKWWQAIHIESASWDHATAQYSTDGGTTWYTMWEHTGSTRSDNWGQKMYDITSAAGGNIWFRFMISSDGSVNYEGWSLDLFEISYQETYTVPTPDCFAIPGGVVAGYVYDDNTLDPLTGAGVISDTGAAGTTFAIPEDPIEGFYWIFQPATITALAAAPVPAAISGGGSTSALTTSGGSVAVAPVTAPPAVNAILWDQPLSTVNQNAYVNQEFPDAPDYSSFLADDFVATMPWTITSLFIPGDGWNGFSSLLNATALNFQIYADNAGIPAGYPGGGAPVWSLSVPPTDPQVTLAVGTPGGYLSNTTLTPASPINLPPGHYWLVYYPTMEFGSYGQFGRQPADTTNGYVGQFINPGGGFGYGSAWQAWTVIGATQQDIAFRIEGMASTSEFHDFTASMDKYMDDTETVEVMLDAINQQDFYLPAGLLSFDPPALEVTMQMGDAPLDETLTIYNDGLAPVDFELTEKDQGYLPPLSIPPFTGTLPEETGPASTGPAPKGNHAASIKGNLFDGLLAGEPAFAVDLNTNELVHIPDTTAPGVWNIIGATMTSLFSGDFIGGDFSTLYAISYTDNNLYTVDTATGAYTLVGTAVSPGGNWTGLSGTPDGTLYGLTSVCNTSTNLVTVDPATAAVTDLGSLPGITCGIDLAYNTNDDMIYIVDIVTDSLFKVDPATMTITLVGATGISANYAQGMDYEEETGVLYWAAFNYDTYAGELRIIDTTTGNSALVGGFPDGAETDCLAFETGGAADVPWLSEDPVSGTVAGEGWQDVTVTFDPSTLGQPGDYLAELKVKHNTPYPVGNIPVTLHLLAPEDYGTFNGTVYGLEACDVNPTPLAEATVNFWQEDVLVATTTTLENGYYSFSVPSGTYDIEVLMDGYVSQVLEGVVLGDGETVTNDFELRLLAPCIVVSPTSLEQWLMPDTTGTKPLHLENTGAADGDFEILEAGATINESLLLEGFEGGVMPPAGGWETIHNGTTTREWTIVDVATYPDFVYEGQYAAWVNYDSSSNSDEWLLTPVLDVSAVTDLTLTFMAESDTSYPGADMKVWVTDETGTPLTPEPLWDLIRDESWSTFEYRQITVDLTEFDGYGDIRVAWQYVGLDGESFGLDLIELTGSLDIPWLSEDPVAGTLAADGGEADITVTFDATGLALGDYFATLKVRNSVLPTINIPVTLHVVESVTRYLWLPVILK